MLRVKENIEKLIIDLDGPEGNAFVILGYAKRIAKELGLNFEETSKILEEMKSGGSYIHLLSVFENYFGDFVILESKKEKKLLSKEDLATSCALERMGYEKV